MNILIFGKHVNENIPMKIKFIDNIYKLIKFYQMNLVDPYHEYFKMEHAKSSVLKKTSYELRYNVYCNELGWEESEQFPKQEETDEFDEWSEHYLLFHRSSKRHAGTIRLVQTHPDFPNRKIPLDKHYNGEYWDTPYHPEKMQLGTYGEISRLALLSSFRKRTGEDKTPDGLGKQLFEWELTERRRFPHIALSLYLSAAAAALSKGMSGVYAMMEPRLARHLSFSGIRFEQVGPPVEFHGKRAPYYISRESLYKHLRRPFRRVLYAIADDLELDIKRNRLFIK